MPKLFLIIRSHEKCMILGNDLPISILSVWVSPVFLSPYKQILGSCFTDTMATSSYTLCKWSSCAAHILDVLVFKGRAKAQVSSRHPLTAQARNPCQAIPCQIYEAQNGSGTCFSLSIIPSKLHTHPNLHVALNIVTNRRNLTFHKSNTSSEMWNYRQVVGI